MFINVGERNNNEIVKKIGQIRIKRNRKKGRSKKMKVIRNYIRVCEIDENTVCDREGWKGYAVLNIIQINN